MRGITRSRPTAGTSSSTRSSREPSRCWAAGHAGVRHGIETWLAHELIAWRDETTGEAVSYWRSTTGFEVDFVLGDHTAIEVKAKASVSPQDLKSLRALPEEKKLKRYLCVSLEPRRRQAEEGTILPWRGRYRG